VTGHKPGDTIKVTFRRGDETKSADVKLGERPVDAG
jgi:S1-C subfamily serine protease